MPTNIIMPQLGESVVDGTVGEWLKSIGDTVAEFEPIVRVSTDKVDTEIPSPSAGVLLEIYVKEGDTVNAGVLLGIVGSLQENLTAVVEAKPATSVVQTPVQANGHDYGGHITPVVARMMAQHQLDLSQIKGSGRNGRVTKKDVEAYLENTSAPTHTDLPAWEQPGSGDLFKPTVEYTLPMAKTEPAPAPQIHQPAPLSSVLPAPTSQPTTHPITTTIPHEIMAISTMRRAIADHMVRSKDTSPHVTTVFEVDLGAVVAHRDANKDAFAKQGVKLTYTPYFVMASAVALTRHPLVNARWTDESILLYNVSHIGIATALEDGLIVPVLRNAQDYNLIGLARQVNDLADRARKKQLRPDEVKDGTFTLTNHGVSGSLFATPIINQPQVAILGVGAIEKRVKVINDAIAIRPCAYLSLTFDHRLIDGATGDGFVSTIKEFLELGQF